MGYRVTYSPAGSGSGSTKPSNEKVVLWVDDNPAYHFLVVRYLCSIVVLCMQFYIGFDMSTKANSEGIAVIQLNTAADAASFLQANQYLLAQGIAPPLVHMFNYCCDACVCVVGVRA